MKTKQAKPIKLSETDTEALLSTIGEWLRLDEGRLDPETVAMRKSLLKLQTKLRKFSWIK